MQVGKVIPGLGSILVASARKGLEEERSWLLLLLQRWGCSGSMVLPGCGVLWQKIPFRHVGVDCFD